MTETALYIGNIPFGVTDGDLRDMFLECGNIVEATIATGDKGRSKGFGTVRFSTHQEAAHAISEYNGADLDGRIIEVRFDKAKPKAVTALKKSAPLKANATEFKPAPEGNGKTLFIGNLAWSVEWDVLKEYLNAVGKVASGEIKQDHQGRSKGFAIVTMASASDAKLVIDSLSGETFHDRPLEVRLDKGSPSKGPSARATPPSAPFAKPKVKAEEQKLVVYNLPGDSTWQQLKDVFKDYGAVSRADVHNKDGELVGYVVLEKSGVARAISELNGSTVDGNEISVEIDDGSHGAPAGEVGVYVGNLPFQVRWQDLKDIFKDEFDPIRADVIMEGPHRSKGFGVVKFATLEEAERVVQEFHGATLQGRSLVVKLDKFN